MKIDPELKKELKKTLESSLEAGKKRAEVVSASKLDAKELEMLYKTVPALKSMVKKFVVDPGIMAGVVIRIGTKMIDLSLNGQLSKLQNKIYATD